jgi:hypothetical protein
MSKEQARQSELKKMELCDSCAGIQRNWRRAPGHAELVQRGNRKEERGGGTVTITVLRVRSLRHRVGIRERQGQPARRLVGGRAVVFADFLSHPAVLSESSPGVRRRAGHARSGARGVQPTPWTG